MAQNERGESPRARFSRSRRLGEGQGRHREVGSGGSPIQKRGATNRNPAEGGMWYTRDERARGSEVLHPQRGVLDTSGVCALNVLGLTLGDLPAVRRSGLRTGEPGLSGRQKSAEGIVGWRQARLGRHPEAERRGNR
jgi:hypothetical protein